MTSATAALIQLLNITGNNEYQLAKVALGLCDSDGRLSRQLVYGVDL